MGASEVEARWRAAGTCDVGVRSNVAMVSDRLVLTEGDDRSELLVRRLAGHSLHTASTDLSSFDAAVCGFRDSGPGTAAASLALRCGLASFRRTDRGGQLVRAMSWRGAPHLHRRSDLDMIRTAMATADINDLVAVAGDVPDGIARLDDPVGQIAASMAEHFDSSPAGTAVSKGALSTAVTSLVASVFVSYCERCEARHVNDASFRLATLRAGLELDTTAKKQTYIRPSPVDCGLPSDDDHAHARKEIVAAAASVAVATDKNALAAWLGWDRASVVRATRQPVAPPRLSRTTRRIRLLPPRDPWLSGSDRVWLLGDRVDRRKDVFRSLGAPGIVLAEGELVGTWRQQVNKSNVAIEIDPWRKLSSSERDELGDDACTIAKAQGLTAHLTLSS